MAVPTNYETQFDLTKQTGPSPIEEVRGTEQHWLEETYDGYNDLVKEWNYVDDWYTGAIAKEPKIQEYLIRRDRAEHHNDYKERRKIAAAVPYVSSVIDSLNGMVFAIEEDAQRDWFTPDEEDTGLGNPEIRGTKSYRLFHNADGMGVSYSPFWQRVGISLLKWTKVYILVEGVVGESQPSFRIIPPANVTNFFRGSDGIMSDYVVKHEGHGRTRIQDPWEKRDRYTHYERTGWSTYEKHDDDFRVIAKGTYNLYDGVERERRVLPIFELCLPLSRNVAYNAARQANRIFNIESEQQAAMRKGMLPRLVLRTNNLDEYNAFVAKTQGGGNVMIQDPSDTKEHYYLPQPTEPAQLAETVLERLVQAYYETNFQEFSDSASAQKTATQIRQESRSSLETILTLLSDTLDEGENRAMFLMEQTEYPDATDRWGIFNVARSKKFQPVDVDAVVDRLKKNVFGNDTVPIGATGEADAAKRLADHYGLSYDDTELENDVNGRRDQAAVDGPFV